MAKTCSYSGCTRGTYKEFCLLHAPRKPLAVRTPLPKAKSPVRKYGKQSKRWQATRKLWFTLNSGYTVCHYCGIGLKPETVTLDHRISRSRAPALRFELSNLVPCCFTCNGLKGSKDHDSYKHICH